MSAEDNPLKLYFRRHKLTVSRSLLLKSSEFVIPLHHRREAIARLHEGHLGISKCRYCARFVIWGLIMNKFIEKIIGNCDGRREVGKGYGRYKGGKVRGHLRE